MKFCEYWNLIINNQKMLRHKISNVKGKKTKNKWQSFMKIKSFQSSGPIFFKDKNIVSVIKNGKIILCVQVFVYILILNFLYIYTCIICLSYPKFIFSLFFFFFLQTVFKKRFTSVFYLFCLIIINIIVIFICFTAHIVVSVQQIF